MRVLLGISGGIAAYKAPELVRRFQKEGWEVGAALSPSATEFVTPTVLKTLCDFIVMESIFQVESEGIGHIDLADWGDLMVVAPATAQTLARLATGQANDPVSLSYLASTAPKLIFPAMNVNMWAAPATRRNVETLRADGATVVEPAAGELACGWLGAGRLPDLDDIVAACREHAGGGGDLAGRRVIVTAGPTREPVDPVRFLSNPSTGRMGFALAARAAARGADAVLVAGPTEQPTPRGVERIDVTTAVEMREAVFAAAQRARPDVLIGAAAVADYRPASAADRKHKKHEDTGLDRIELVPNPDVLAEAVAAFAPAVSIGFAAETDDVIDHAKAKLARKGLSLIVANDVGAPEGGFGDERNRVWLVDPAGAINELPLSSKAAIADGILDAAVGLLARTPA